VFLVLVLVLFGPAVELVEVLGGGEYTVVCFVEVEVVVETPYLGGW